MNNIRKIAFVTLFSIVTMISTIKSADASLSPTAKKVLWVIGAGVAIASIDNHRHHDNNSKFPSLTRPTRNETMQNLSSPRVIRVTGDSHELGPVVHSCTITANGNRVC